MTIPTQRGPWDDDPEVARLDAQDREREFRASTQPADWRDPLDVYRPTSFVEMALPGRWSWPIDAPPATPPSHVAPHAYAPDSRRHSRRKPSLLERLRRLVRRG